MNSKINAILIDDEPRATSLLTNMLHQICPDVCIVAECYDADSAKDLIRKLHPDLIFLDVAMPGKTGLQMLQELPGLNTRIIFVTAYDRHSIDAFRFSAVDYLLKPVDETALEAAVARARKAIETSKMTDQLQTLAHNLSKQLATSELKICLPTLKGFQVLDVRNIICCEAQGSYTAFHLAAGPTIIVSRSLHDYEDWLQEAHFVRVHKSYLINLRHVREYQRGEGGIVILSNGKEIEVARRRKDWFLASMHKLYDF